MNNLFRVICLKTSTSNCQCLNLSIQVDYQMTRYRTSKKSLRIRDVDKTDSGRFTCKGINGFGKEEIKIDLIIIDPLDFPGLPEGALPEVFPFYLLTFVMFYTPPHFPFV